MPPPAATMALHIPCARTAYRRRKRPAQTAQRTAHLNERNHDEPRAALGVVYEHGLESDPEPFALAADPAVVHISRLPLTLVRPGEQAVVLHPAALEPGQKSA